jgi:hypothetical protein
MLKSRPFRDLRTRVLWRSRLIRVAPNIVVEQEYLLSARPMARSKIAVAGLAALVLLGWLIIAGQH